MPKKIDTAGLKHFKDKENAMVASEFSASKSYAIGEYVYYKGTLYKFKAAHAAGAWTTADVDAVKLADDVSVLKESINDISSIYNYYDPKAEYRIANSSGATRTGYTINADGSITATNDYGNYGEFLLYDDSIQLKNQQYTISGKITTSNQNPTGTKGCVLRVGIGGVTVQAPNLTTERNGDATITAGSNTGWFKATFTPTADQTFCFGVMPTAASWKPAVIEQLMITEGSEVVEYTDNVLTAKDALARSRLAEVSNIITSVSNIDKYLDVFGSCVNLKYIEKGSTDVTVFYDYQFTGGKTYIVRNDTNAAMSFYTRTEKTASSENTLIDQPFGGALLPGAQQEFTASGDAIYFQTYNIGAGTIVIGEKNEDTLSNYAIEKFGEYGIYNARSFFKNGSTISYQYQYNFVAGKKYAVINNTSAGITFQTRMTRTGTSIDVVDGLASGALKTFTATVDATYFNSYSTGAGTIIVGEVISNLGNYIEAKDIFNAEPYTNEYDWQTPVASYGALFKGLSNVESFAFFTDPHVMGFADDNRNEERMENYFKRVQKTYNSTPCSFLVCGGDLLNNGTTMDEACYRLGYIEGVSNHLFDNCKIVLGNHDTNYQGKQDSESADYTGRLTDATIASIMYRDTDTKKAYYSFEGSNSKCYVLDTGIEHTTMLSYDWEQVDWLAEQLKSDDAEHAIIFLHIIIVSNTVQTNSSNFGSLVEAYNNHTTIELNSKTYDFTGCIGHVDFWVAGHTHTDSTGTLGGIPYFITATNSYNSDVPLIDLVLADYENRVLKLVRVGGTGQDRTISLDVT